MNKLIDIKTTMYKEELESRSRSSQYIIQNPNVSILSFGVYGHSNKINPLMHDGKFGSPSRGLSLNKDNSHVHSSTNLSMSRNLVPGAIKVSKTIREKQK